MTLTDGPLIESKSFTDPGRALHAFLMFFQPRQVIIQPNDDGYRLSGGCTYGKCLVRHRPLACGLQVSCSSSGSRTGKVQRKIPSATGCGRRYSRIDPQVDLDVQIPVGTSQH